MMFLSAGHSGTDPGAVAFGRREADIAVEFRNIVSFYLTRAGVQHELDGKGTENIPLRQAVQKARRHRVAVEFHCNAFHSEAANGCEALSSAKNAGLAADLSAAVAEGLGIFNRGAKAENAGQHSRLAFVQAGGIILELFFITSRMDLAAYDARKWLAARAVAEVLASA